MTSHPGQSQFCENSRSKQAHGSYRSLNNSLSQLVETILLDGICQGKALHSVELVSCASGNSSERMLYLLMRSNKHTHTTKHAIWAHCAMQSHTEVLVAYA